MKNQTLASLFVTTLLMLALTNTAQAMTIDWSGYFRADHRFIHNYQIDKSAPGSSVDPAAGGEYIQGQGQRSGTYSSVFLKLKPKVLVSDNVIVRSEWNVGDPVTGFFGQDTPTEDRNNLFSTSKGGMDITAARLWLDTHTDFGTLQVGRAPLHWGLGAIFNSGDKIWDRYQSTTDTIRLVSKFGFLTLMPLYAKESSGRNLVGARNPISDGILSGSDDVTDYGFALKYDNPEEDLQAGLIYYKRNANDTQGTFFYPSTATQFTAGANGMNLKLLDLYAQKKWKRLEAGIEVPIFTGTVGDVNGVRSRNAYRATAIALEAALNYDSWKHQLKLGRTPGQAPGPVTGKGDTFGALYLHRAYKLGLIMFNTNLGNFGANNPDPIPGSGTGNAPASTVSPYDAAIVNARYLMLATEKRWEQWSMGFSFIYATAEEAASAGSDFYNHRTKRWNGSAAVVDQSKNLGMEFDFGTRYNWDDQITFGLDVGFMLPGDYYAFINKTNQSAATNMVSAFALTAGTSF